MYVWGIKRAEVTTRRLLRAWRKIYIWLVPPTSIKTVYILVYMKSRCAKSDHLQELEQILN